MKKLSVFVALAVLATASVSHAQEAEKAPERKFSRSIAAFNFTADLGAGFDLTFMPASRFEWGQSTAGVDKLGHYMDELYFGPNYKLVANDVVSFTFSAWYYLIGTPDQLGYGAYHSQHNLLLIPSIDLKLDRFNLGGRVILQNGFVNTQRPDSPTGYGLLGRGQLRVRYAIIDMLGVSVGGELFKTLKDGEGADLMFAVPKEFTWQFQTGVDVQASEFWNIGVGYVLEATTSDGDPYSSGNYFNLTVSYSPKNQK